MKCVKVESKPKRVVIVDEIPAGECFIRTAGAGANQMVFKYMKLMINDQIKVEKDECAAVDLEMGCVIKIAKKQEVVPILTKVYYDTQVRTEL
jgi:hypothetical protein